MALEPQRARVISLESIAHETILLRLAPEVALPYRAGQFITLRIPQVDGKLVGRSYSIASRRGVNEIDLIIKLVAGGQGSDYVRSLQAGDEVLFMGPFGKFVLPEMSQSRALFAGTGSGIGPFVPMIDELLAFTTTAVTLLAGYRHDQDVIASLPLAEWQAFGERFTHITTLSQSTDAWTGSRGRVTDYLASNPGLFDGSDVFICGNGSMVAEVKVLAEQAGVPAGQVFLEKYNNL